MKSTHNQRTNILKAVRKRILKSHFNVSGVNYDDWAKLFDERSVELLNLEEEGFELGVQDLLKELKSSHTGFYHERPTRLLAQHTINATLGRSEEHGYERWFFLDVFEGGPADGAGVKRGDILLAVDGVNSTPPTMPPFRTGVTHRLSIAAPDGTAAREITISVPRQKGNKNLPPILPPKSISGSMIGDGTGLLKISWFPGSMGLGFARELDLILADLKENGCQRLIIDLRGNIGGGLGFARLASYLCSDRRAIGYSLTPTRQRRGYTVEDFERVTYPDSAFSFAVTLARFAMRDKSIFLMTQGLGTQPFHGKVAILVNEWTNSAAEMVAGFALENGLATIVGVKTPGNVLGAVNVKVGSGYWLRLPVFGWFTNDGRSLEGRGITPDAKVGISPSELQTNHDRQLSAAVEILRNAKVVTGGSGRLHASV